MKTGTRVVNYYPGTRFEVILKFCLILYFTGRYSDQYIINIMFLNAPFFHAIDHGTLVEGCNWVDFQYNLSEGCLHGVNMQLI